MIMDRILKKITPIFLLAALLVVSPFILLSLPIIVHVFIDARYIPGLSMEPAIPAGSRIIFEKVSRFLKVPLRRGSIVIIHPPEMELPLEQDPASRVLGDTTGLAFFPQTPAFVKRIVGLPGEHVLVKSGLGVFINNQFVDETEYIKSPPSYSLSVLNDIGGTSFLGRPVHPYPKDNRPIVVPADSFFVLGDNRNRSDDSHVCGFIKQDRIFANAWIMWSPEFRFVDERPTALSKM